MKRLIRKSAYLRLLLPAVLVAALVMDGLVGYVAPEIAERVDVVTQPVYAADVPELELQEHTEERVVPQGTAGELARVRESGDYADGTYTGSAKGFGGTITVRVTIKDGKISSISVVSASGEGSSYLARAKSVIGRIIGKQSTNVDAVSGATYSSNGIIKAVRNALKKAGGRKTADEDPEETGEGDNDPGRGDGSGDTTGGDVTPPDEETEFKDGTYSVIGACTRNGLFDYDINITVIVKDHIITDIGISKGEDFTDEDHQEDNDGYLALAADGAAGKGGMIDRIIKAQNADVDTVTGATYSSNTIRNSVAALLREISVPVEKKDDQSDDLDNEDEENPADGDQNPADAAGDAGMEAGTVSEGSGEANDGSGEQSERTAGETAGSSPNTGGLAEGGSNDAAAADAQTSGTADSGKSSANASGNKSEETAKAADSGGTQESSKKSSSEKKTAKEEAATEDREDE